MRRRKLNRRSSESYFTRAANRVHRKNTLGSGPMRAGIRF